MSLDAYRRPRMIVLHPSSTVYDAARAMLDNHVGAILVADRADLVGIVTDRDIVAEVVAAGLDPWSTFVGDIVSERVRSVDVAASLHDVVQLMREQACRRVPITESGKLVGFVTLDDLLVERAIDPELAADIVRRQLEIGARSKKQGAVHPEPRTRPDSVPRATRAITRHNARADSSYARLLRGVERQTNLAQGRAALALTIVIGSLCRRVLPNEAGHVLAQLPSKLHDQLGAYLDGPDRSITRESIETEIAIVLDVSPAEAADIVEGIGRAIVDSLSEGQLVAFRGQLPLDLKELVAPRVRRAV